MTNRFDVYVNAATSEDVGAHSFRVGASGALVFEDENGDAVVAYAPGRWNFVERSEVEVDDVIDDDDNSPLAAGDLVKIVRASLPAWEGLVFKVSDAAPFSNGAPWLRVHETPRPDGFVGGFTWPLGQLKKVG